MISKPYLNLLKSQPKPSRYVKEIADEIARYAAENNLTTVLDWGCGHEHQLQQSTNWATPIHEYDPAVAGYDKKPRPVELVVCIDVLQCVEEAYIDRVLDELAYLTEQVLWLVIDLELSPYSYDNGMNQNVTVRDRSWWLSRIRKQFTIEWLDYTGSWMELRARPTGSRRVTKLRTVDQWQQRIGR